MINKIYKKTPLSLVNKIKKAWRNLTFTCALGTAMVSCTNNPSQNTPFIPISFLESQMTSEIKEENPLQSGHILSEKNLQSAKTYLSNEFIKKYAEELEKIGIATGDKASEAYLELPTGLMETHPVELVLIAQEYGEITPALFNTFGEDVIEIVNKYFTELDKIIEFSGVNAYETCEKILPTIFKDYPALMVRTTKIAREFSPDVYEVMLAYFDDEEQWNKKLDGWEINKEKYGITHFYRYLGTTLLEENIKNLDKKHKPPRPIALIIHNQNDWNGAFSYGWYWKELEKMTRSYRVFTYEISGEEDMFKFIKETYHRAGNKKIAVWIAGGHGTAVSLNWGISGKQDKLVKRENLKGYEQFYLDVTDKKQLKEYASYFYPSVWIPLVSCSTGKGKEGADNLANMLGQVFPKGTIFTPTVSSHIKQLNFNKNHRLIGVDYDQGIENTYIISPLNKSTSILKPTLKSMLEKLAEEINSSSYQLEKKELGESF